MVVKVPFSRFPRGKSSREGEHISERLPPVQRARDKTHQHGGTATTRGAAASRGTFRGHRDYSIYFEH